MHLACLNTSCTLSGSNVSDVAKALCLLGILIIEKILLIIILLYGKGNVINNPEFKCVTN